MLHLSLLHVVFCLIFILLFKDFKTTVPVLGYYLGQDQLLSFIAWELFELGLSTSKASIVVVGTHKYVVSHPYAIHTRVTPPLSFTSCPLVVHIVSDTPLHPLESRFFFRR